MKQHTTDLTALVFGVAFAISGAVIIVTQRTSVDVGPLWGIAIVAIAVGAVTLLVTLARSRHEPIEAPAADVSSEPVSVATSEPADDVVEG